MAIFSVQLPTQSQVKQEKRGQQPFQVDKKQDIRGTMLAYAPTITQVPKDADHAFVGKSIRNSRIREQWQGLVVGLQRGSHRILNPDPETLLQTDDLLLIVGANEKINITG